MAGADAVKTGEVLQSVAGSMLSAHAAEDGASAASPPRAQVGGEAKVDDATIADEKSTLHPLLERRAEKKVLFVVMTADRGLCGAFNTNINKAAEREWRARRDEPDTKVEIGQRIEACQAVQQVPRSPGRDPRARAGRDRRVGRRTVRCAAVACSPSRRVHLR